MDPTLHSACPALRGRSQGNAQLLGMKGADKETNIWKIRLQLMKPVTWIPLIWGAEERAPAGRAKRVGGSQARRSRGSRRRCSTRLQAAADGLALFACITMHCLRASVRRPRAPAPRRRAVRCCRLWPV